jgi:hypothetical protein
MVAVRSGANNTPSWLSLASAALDFVKAPSWPIAALKYEMSQSELLTVHSDIYRHTQAHTPTGKKEEKGRSEVSEGSRYRERERESAE